MATRMPPRAVPSSLVITSPLTPATLRKISTWLSAFCPVVASTVCSTVCGASGSCLPSTRTIFSSSAISSARFCSRPAVSMISTSEPASLAFSKASQARPEASAPSFEATTGEPVRSPQIFSCSIAAARNVSPAASMTLSPPSESFAASLPIVVVLPVPLTPTTRMTCGLCDRSSSSGMATGASTFSISTAMMARTSASDTSRP